MKTLNPSAQLNVLARIWGNDRDGYVFLPWIGGNAATSDARRKNYHEGRAFEWPRERDAILEHLTLHTDDDLYFTPALFNAKRRIEQNVDAERTLWADLDPVDPRGLGDLRPTIAWETSPGRYQAVWLLNAPLVGASWPSRENHRLSLHLGADPSGWDSTQLLRIPGRLNHKPIYRDDEGNPAEGKLLWDNGPRYTWPDFEDLPEISSQVSSEFETLADESFLEAIDRREVWDRVRLRVTKRCRELMSARDTAGADRSSVLWEIERELADAGCTAPEIIVLIRPSVWNKYSGRNDELKRLKIEAAKAIAEKVDSPVEEEAVEKPKLTWLSDIMLKPIPRPRWLVKDIWVQGGCGFIAGAPKSYKSYIGLDLAVSVSTGTPFLGAFPTVQRPVLYLQEEDDLKLVVDRLESIIEARVPERFWAGQMSCPSVDIGAGESRPVQEAVGPVEVIWSPPVDTIPIALQVQSGFVASDSGWQAWLDDQVEENKFGLIIVDTLGTSAGEVDTDRAAELIHKILKPLKQIANKHDVAICIVHHNRKPNNGNNRAGMEMLGSVALHAWVDCALYARTKDALGVVGIEREAKFAPDKQFRLKIPFMFKNYVTGERQLWVPEFLEDDVDQVEPPKDRHQQSQRGTAGKALAIKLKACGGGPMTEKKLQEIIGGRAIGGQVESAIMNGFIDRDAEGRLTVTEGV